MQSKALLEKENWKSIHKNILISKLCSKKVYYKNLTFGKCENNY